MEVFNNMPTYEYECEVCENRFEALQSIKAKPIKECPKCKGHVRRLISAGAGVIFKGSGFYATDYRSEKYKSDAKKDKDVDKSSSSSTDKKDKDVDKPSSSSTDKKDKDVDKPSSSSTDKKD
jgi:putative FmdB family regulatory protein